MRPLRAVTGAKYKDPAVPCTLLTMPDLAYFPIMIVAILVALTVHEWAHAFVAKRLGDDTAESMGRLTLNPIAHIDPLGAILFLLVGFGWAKPVPVDARNFRHPVRDNAIVALAGPVSNLILAFVSFIIQQLSGADVLAVSLAGEAVEPWSAGWSMFAIFLSVSIGVNLALMAFNLLPIAPLDGSNILRMFIPWRLRDRYEELMQYGPWILLAVILAESFLNVPVLSTWVYGISRVVMSAFAFIL